MVSVPGHFLGSIKSARDSLSVARRGVISGSRGRRMREENKLHDAETRFSFGHIWGHDLLTANCYTVFKKLTRSSTQK